MRLFLVHQENLTGPNRTDLVRKGYGIVVVGAEVVGLIDLRNVRLVWDCPGKLHLSAIVPLIIGK